MSHLYKNNQIVVQLLMLGMVLCWTLSSGTGHNCTFFWKLYIKKNPNLHKTWFCCITMLLNKVQPRQPHAYGE